MNNISKVKLSTVSTEKVIQCCGVILLYNVKTCHSDWFDKKLTGPVVAGGYRLPWGRQRKGLMSTNTATRSQVEGLQQALYK